MGNRYITALLVTLVVACSRDSKRTVAHAQGDTARRRPAPSPFADSGKYRVIPLAAIGRIAGTVEFEGPAPVDSVVHVTTDVDLCGATLVDITVEHRGPRLANAVVWLEGLTAGKRMPVARRYDITTAGCRVLPRVQAATAGGTLDVRNDDDGSHIARFTSWPGGEPLATVPETESGAVVPSPTVLAKPGLVLVRCDLHPWSRGWVAVFGHPYFTTSDVNGAFTIDSVPPGRYCLVVWHERFGMHSDSVTVTAGQAAVVAEKLKAP